MLEPKFPFLKPKPAPVILALPCSRKTTLFSLKEKDANALTHPIIDITRPWNRFEQKENIVQKVMTEYAIAFPSCRTPSNADLIEWMYQRMLAAQDESRLLEIELRVLSEGSRGI